MPGNLAPEGPDALRLARQLSRLADGEPRRRALDQIGLAIAPVALRIDEVDGFLDLGPLPFGPMRKLARSHLDAQHPVGGMLNQLDIGRAQSGGLAQNLLQTLLPRRGRLDHRRLRGLAIKRFQLRQCDRLTTGLGWHLMAGSQLCKFRRNLAGMIGLHETHRAVLKDGAGRAKGR